MACRICLLLLFLAAACCLPCHVSASNEKRNDELREHLEKKLPVLGHRNWIVIADMAYPEQSNPGIETIYVGGDHARVIREVLSLVEKAPHVRPNIHHDKELDVVAEEDAPGIDAFRDELAKALQGRQTTQLMHDDIIAKLDEAGRTFKVLILKTDCTLPYTSVFLQLECGYWSDAAEQKVRAALK